MSKSDKPNKSGVQVSFVEFGSSRRSHQVVASLATDGLKVTDVFAETKRLKDALDFVDSVHPALCDGDGVTLTLALRAADPYGDSYMTDQRREALLAELSPKCTRKVSASAEVVRAKDGKHEQTRVTVTLVAGDALTGLRVKQYDNTDGILRGRVTSGACTIVFTMAEPAANDDDGAITKVVEALAAKIGAMLVHPVNVIENDPNAALDPNKDWTPAEAAA